MKTMEQIKSTIEEMQLDTVGALVNAAINADSKPVRAACVNLLAYGVTRLELNPTENSDRMAERYALADFLEGLGITKTYGDDERDAYRFHLELVTCYTADKATGTFIDDFETVSDAKRAIERYEEKDKADGTYEPDFYDVVDAEHCSLL